jgi:hypothetical protein
VEDPPRHLEHEHARREVTAEAFSRPRARARLAAVGLVLAGLMGMAAEAPAQASPPNYLELRLAHSDGGVYRYVEYARFLRSGPVVDALYLGVPGQNELYVGVGYPLKATSALTVTPLVYGVVGKESDERGVALGLFVLGTVRRWNVYSFLGYFEPVAGDVPRYFFLDSLDLSHKLARWELGFSTGVFQSAGEWSTLFGPLVVRNDGRGAWRASLRGGSAFEVRLTRTLAF